MKGRNVAVFIVILFLAVAGILYMMYETRRIDVSLGDQQTLQNTNALTDTLNSMDYELYWIGQLPDHLEGIEEHVTLLTVGEANSDTLPIAAGNTGMTRTDRDGNVISHTEPRDYAQYMMIVINTTEELPETLLDVIRDCSVINHVPVLIIGKNNIDAFRSYMMLVHRNYDVNSTMCFEISRGGEDDPIDPSIVSAGGHDYADAVLSFIIDRFENPAVVYVTPAEIQIPPTEETDNAA